MVFQLETVGVFKLLHIYLKSSDQSWVPVRTENITLRYHHIIEDMAHAILVPDSRVEKTTDSERASLSGQSRLQIVHD